MALAFLRLDDVSDEGISFHADIGSNRFYRFKIGKEKSSFGGLEQIEQASYVSPILEHPESDSFSTAFLLQIPKQHFDPEDRLVQLYSFRDAKGNGPGVSKVLEVFYPDIRGNVFLSQSLKSEATQRNMAVSPFNPCRSSTFSFQESQLSQGLFLEALLQIAGNLAPHIGQAVAGLLNRSGSGGAVSSDSILQMINTIINALPRSGPTAPGQPASTAPVGTSPAVAPAPAQPSTGGANSGVSAPQSLRYGYGFGRGAEIQSPRFKPKKTNLYTTPLSYRTLRNLANGRQPYSSGMIIDGGVITGPLLASAIGPLLQSAPQLIQAIGDLPLRLMALRSQERIQRQQIDQDYIVRLLQGIEQQENMQALLRVLGTGGGAASTLSMMPNPLFRAVLQKENSIEVNGKQKFVYIQKSDITFLLHLQTEKKPPERAIPKVIVSLKVKSPDTLRPLLEKTFRFKDVKIGTSLGLTLSAAEIEKLPTQTDLMLCTDFRWQGRDGKTLSLTDNHLIFLVKGAWLRQVGEITGKEIALLDPVEYKVFWNKIWESPSSGGRRWRAAFETKYYLYYQPDKTANARVETRLKMDKEQSESSDRRLEIRGRLKSALELSPVELNKLLPRMNNKTELPEEQLEAFRSDELRRHLNLQASANLELKGRENEQGSLWVFPEINLRRFILSATAQTESTGQVVKTTEMDVEFPIPASVHFVGALTV